MTSFDTTLIIALLCISAFLFAVPLIYGTAKIVFSKKTARTTRSSISSWLAFSVFLIGAIWCLRYSVGYYRIITYTDGDGLLSRGEEIFNSIIHALQTFSMDEDYTDYILAGKEMVASMFGEEPVWVYGLYASVLNILAPIAGGAIIFEILASIFPMIKLHATRWIPWKDVYYFSELNEASLSVMKSLRADDPSVFTRPTVIFTDVYGDDDNEHQTELKISAKQYGAVCLKDDLVHIPKNIFGKNKVFLINEKEVGNLRALSNLVQNAKASFLKKSDVYLFSQSDAYVRVEKQARAKLKQRGFSENDMPNIMPIQRFRNLVTNLLVDYPLYEPLVGKAVDGKKDMELNISIVGAGQIGVEMFLSCYWFSQILNVKTTVSIVSAEDEEQFWNKIDQINPEIHSTTLPLDSVGVKNDILKYNSREYSEPYCYINYKKCDINSSDFMSLLKDKDDIAISKADYILVALGSDERNISAANQIYRHIGQRHIERLRDENKVSKTLIAYVVYDPDLSNALNCENAYRFAGDRNDIYMRAVGSTDELYSHRNIFMEDFGQRATEIKATNGELLEADYKFWAEGARKMHHRYKAFSIGAVKHSVFDIGDKYTREQYDRDTLSAIEEYKKFAFGEGEYKNAPDRERIISALSWIEHRRWCAFTRVKGFRGDWLYEQYAPFVHSYKHWELKLHPCLVECDKRGVSIESFEMPDGEIKDISARKIDNLRIYRNTHTNDCEEDKLDQLSRACVKAGLCKGDFKIYDYPCHDFKN